LGRSAYDSREQGTTLKFESEGRRLTKNQKRAIIVGAFVILAAIIIPVVSVAVYQSVYGSKFLQKKVSFYVNNGLDASSYTVKISREQLNYYKDEPHPSHFSLDPNYTASVIESYCTTNEKLLMLS